MASERHTEITDEQLVAGILAGEEGYFTLLHQRYGDRILRFAIKRLRDPVEAEDVTQDVFLEVHRCLASFKGHSSLLTWMFGIAHNQVCRRFRRRTPIMLSLDEPEAAELAAPQVPVDRQVDVARIFEQCSQVLERELTATQQQAFRLRYGENQSTRSIAHKLGKSNQAVKIGLFRSRRALARHSPDLQVALSA
jgi:RNA polymerase sigma factor (sigma-70 family)